MTSASSRPNPIHPIVAGTLVRATPARTEVEGRLGQLSVDDVLATELGPENQEELTNVIVALELLSRLLTPEVSDQPEAPTPGRQAG